MQELRETIYQLRANVSEENEFPFVAADYLARFEERTGIHTVWAPDTVGRLPYRVEQELWRIVQEALANVERHSGASQVVVRWDVDDRGARLEVSDDGKGFDPGRVAGDHYGIVGMRERADAIGARLRSLAGPAQERAWSSSSKPRRRASPSLESIRMSDHASTNPTNTHGWAQRQAPWCSWSTTTSSCARPCGGRSRTPGWKSWPRPATAARPCAWPATSCPTSS